MQIAYHQSTRPCWQRGGRRRDHALMFQKVVYFSSLARDNVSHAPPGMGKAPLNVMWAGGNTHQPT